MRVHTLVTLNFPMGQIDAGVTPAAVLEVD